jgi:hypothetical protein
MANVAPVSFGNGAHVCGEQRHALVIIAALVSKAGGEVTLSRELIEQMETLPIMIRQSDGEVELRLIGNSFGVSLKGEPEGETS